MINRSERSYFTYLNILNLNCNIHSHAENLKYFDGNLYWVSEVDGKSELVTYNVMSRGIESSRKLASRPFKLVLFQQDSQRVYGNNTTVDQSNSEYLSPNINTFSSNSPTKVFSNFFNDN